jgi:hypothetical protein
MAENGKSWGLKVRVYQTASIFEEGRMQGAWTERHLSNPLVAAHAELCANGDASEVIVSSEETNEWWRFTAAQVLAYRTERCKS